MALAGPLPAQATTHGLIMTIGAYADPGIQLKGGEADARLAQTMARQLGVSERHTIRLHNEALSLQGLRTAWSTLSERVQPGDKVFIYFSGHGTQRAKADGEGCSEGLVMHDGRVLFDVQLRDRLLSLARKAGQLWVFVDACHAGGAVEKSWGNDAPQAKVYPGEPLLADGPGELFSKAGDGACGTPVNLAKALGVLGASAEDKLLYVAAAAPDEAAFGTEQGSAATRAWAACLTAGQADTGQGLAHCAQQWLARNLPKLKQTITTRFNGRMGLPVGAAARP
jgi:metacaspase-1